MGNGSVSCPSGLSRGFATRAEAKAAQNDFSSEHKSYEVKVFESYFIYKCE